MQKEQQMQTKPSQPTETVSRPTGIKMALLLFWEFIKLGAFTFGSGCIHAAAGKQRRRQQGGCKKNLLFVHDLYFLRKWKIIESMSVGEA